MIREKRVFREYCDMFSFYAVKPRTIPRAGLTITHSSCRVFPSLTILSLWFYQAVSLVCSQWCEVAKMRVSTLESERAEEWAAAPQEQSSISGSFALGKVE